MVTFMLLSVNSLIPMANGLLGACPLFEGRAGGLEVFPVQPQIPAKPLDVFGAWPGVCATQAGGQILDAEAPIKRRLSHIVLLQERIPHPYWYPSRYGD